MAFRNISVLLTANSSSLRSNLIQASREVDVFSQKVKQHHAGIISSSGLMQKAMVGGAAAVGAALAYSVVNAAKFEQEMRNVNSISYLSESQFKSLGKSVLDLSTRLPQSAHDLAKGLYDIASSGFQGADGLTVLQASAVAASAGMSTTANSAKAITAVLNAYGLGASHATDVSDALFQTVNLGVINFDELTGVIGDVVGTAAAAGVNINQVGSAIATMTLSGISGAEAGTSLNRVLQSLIKPSDALKVVYKQLGYESGASALKQKGLHGVMEDLRKTTGGSVEGLLALFPEIRAARGAFSLMANDGKTYNKVSGQIEDSTKRTGSTMRAFKEQSKAVAFQWDIFVNKVNKGSILIGSKLLPVMLAAMHLVANFGTGVGDVLKRLGPFFQHVASIGVDLWTVIKRMTEVASPLAKALLGVVLVPLIEFLNTASGLLSSLVHFVTDNNVAFTVLATTIGVALVPAIYRMVAGLAASVFSKAVVGLSDLLFAAEAAAGGFSYLAAAEAGATLGLSAIVAGAILSFEAIRHTSQGAKREISSLYSEMRAKDKNDPGLMSNSLADLQKRLAQQKAIMNKLGTTTIGSGFNRTTLPFRFTLDFAGDKFDKAKAKVSQLQTSIKDLTRDQRHVSDNMQAIANQTGVSWEDIVQIADQGNIDLTKGYGESNKARDAVIAKIKEMETQSGTSMKVLGDATGQDVAKMQALAAAIDEATKKSTEAFASANDVLSGFKLDDGSKAADAQAKASDKLAKAQQKLEDLQARQAAKKRLTVADDQALAKARRDVAAATDGVTKAENQKPASAGAQLKQYYRDQIKQSQDFIDGINTLTNRGLDPQMIARLLEAGPAQAAPLIQTMVKDNSGKLIAMVNESEDKLREISSRVAEFTRLTTLATTSATDGMVKDLGMAMKIASANMAEGGVATADAIAKALGVPSAEVTRVAEEYGISLFDSIQAGLNNNPLVPPQLDTSGKPVRRGKADITAAASGGYITGPGSGTSDSIHARLSNGEFVVRAAAVKAYGVRNLHRINAYSQGGEVGARGTTGLAPGATYNTYSTVNRYEFSGPIVGVKLEDAERYAARKRQIKNLAGAPG